MFADDPTMTIEASSLLSAIPAELAEEWTEVLASRGNLRIERIVSRGHASPAGFWYDQDETEWVVLIAGRARLEFRDPRETVDLVAGDFLTIAAHRQHRVDWTTPEENTIWLAIFHT
jgi:cupin 2 domain-containing protein